MIDWIGSKKSSIGVYTPRSADGTHTVDFLYKKVHCNFCETATSAHDTCENCGYHGDFDEFGEDATCPKCSWGYPT